MGKSHGCMARDGHELPKVSLEPAMPKPSTSYGLAVSGVVRLQGRRPAAVFYSFEHPTPYAIGKSHTPEKEMQNCFWFSILEFLQFYSFTVFFYLKLFSNEKHGFRKHVRYYSIKNKPRIHLRHRAWCVQRGRRRLQVAPLAGGPPLKWL
jgi:hypothetical protein